MTLMSSQALKHCWIGFLDDGFHFLIGYQVQCMFNLLKELLVCDHLPMQLVYRVLYPVFEVLSDDLDPIEVGGTRKEEEHCHS